MPMLLDSWPLLHFKHFFHMRGVAVPFKNVASNSALDHFDLEIVLDGVGIQNTGGVHMDRPDHCLVYSVLDFA